jgi:phage major head subunit gpT-like protein
MDITPSVLRNMRATFSNLFRGAYDRTPVFYPQLCTTVPSTTSQNNYGWMAQLPRMREWIGARVLNNLITHSYVLSNLEWELSFSVARRDIEDDNLGQYSMVSEAHGEAARKHPDELLVEVLQNGHSVSYTSADGQTRSGLCFDGQPFFNGSHPIAPKGGASGTYSNYDASGAALSAANYRAKRAMMAAYVGDNGGSLNTVPDLLVVPPQLESTAKEIVEADRNAAGATNVDAGTAKVLMLPELGNQATTWYLLCTRRVIKPFVYQPRRALSFLLKANLTDDNVAYNKQFDFLSDSRDNLGFTLPFLAYKGAA